METHYWVVVLLAAGGFLMASDFKKERAEPIYGAFFLVVGLYVHFALAHTNVAEHFFPGSLDAPVLLNVLGLFVAAWALVLFFHQVWEKERAFDPGSYDDRMYHAALSGMIGVSLALIHWPLF